MSQKPNRRRSSVPRNSFGDYARRLASDKARFVVFCAFVGLVFAMGGGSRGDILSLPFLRPMAFLVGAYALLVATPDDLRSAAWPLTLLGCLCAVIALQLVPLPQSWWSSLSGRQLYVQIAKDAGLPLRYRPLTLSPSRTLNALFSLSVPFSAILICAVQSQHHRPRIWTVFLVACALSALMAIAQTASAGSSFLYLYQITNNGFPVGLFANRNHQALLMVILLVLMAHFYRRRERSGRMGRLPAIGMAFAALVVFALILVAGSRAGLLLAVLAIPVIAVIHYRDQRRPPGDIKAKFGPKSWAAMIAGGLILLTGAAIAFSRAASVERLWSGDALNDYRVDRLPVLVHMLRDHWLFGIGYGAFEGAFRRYESVNVLTPFTFNQAHNDWLQFPMEGGLAGAALLTVVVAWLSMQVYRAIRSGRKHFDGTRMTLLTILVLIALASVVDYPLRTPIFMLVGAAAFTELARRSSVRSGESYVL